MRRTLATITAAAAVGIATLTAVGSRPATASPDQHLLGLHEHATDSAQLDLGTPGPGLGDQLIGTAVLIDPADRPAGRDTFLCVSVSADDTRFQCAVTYELPAGRITAQGNATITGQHPLFDELFAITGGTRAYRTTHGQVRIRQLTFDDAELTIDTQP